MITTRLYLDTRAITDKHSPAPVKIMINKRGKSALLSTGVKVLVSNWDKKTLSVIKSETRSNINTYLLQMKLKVDSLIQQMVLSGKAADMTVIEIKNEIKEFFDGVPASHQFGTFANEVVATKTSGTQAIYLNDLVMVRRFDKSVDKKLLRDFTSKWASEFDAWLLENYSAGTRRQVVANVSAIFNVAVKKGILRRNPLSELRTPSVPTRKRNLSVERFRALWNLQTDNERWNEALDLFKFSFLTIAMNAVDVLKLTEDSIFNGRIEYDRSKTGKHYSIKIVDELLPLLEKYRKNGRLFDAITGMPDVRRQKIAAIQAFRKVCDANGFQGVSLYWARHSWASFAAELDVPIEVISAALGHSHGEKVTLVYINPDIKKVDDAHRRVIDFALYGNK